MARPKEWKVVCTRCLEEGEAKWVVPGDAGLELLVCVLSLPLLCIPGLALAAYRRMQAHWSCDVCGSPDVVPRGSKRAQLILQGSEE